MATELITIKEFCIHHHTDAGFIHALVANGLIEIVQEEEEQWIRYEQLEQLESYTRWHRELELNVEGIEAVQHLVQRIRDMQEHIHRLEQRLKRYEE